MPTGIGWTDVTVNVMSGCTPVSAGCDHCYAERTAPRLAGRFGYPAKHPFRVTLHPDRLARLFELPGRKRIFLDSMGDLFHADVPDDYIAAVMGAVSCLGQHTHQILTKRPHRMLDWFRRHELGDCQHEFLTKDAYSAAVDVMVKRRHVHPLANSAFDGNGHNRWPLPNLHLVATAENQEAADERLPLLLQTPAAVRGVSLEPLLGPIDLELAQCSCPWPHDAVQTRHLLCCPADQRTPTSRRRWGLDWVIAGGETGPHARAMHPEWIRHLRDRCGKARVPFFFKQWGRFRPREPGDPMDASVYYVDFDGRGYDWRHDPGGGAYVMRRLAKRDAGDLLDGQRHREFPNEGPGRS